MHVFCRKGDICDKINYIKEKTQKLFCVQNIHQSRISFYLSHKNTFESDNESVGS